MVDVSFVTLEGVGSMIGGLATVGGVYGGLSAYRRGREDRNVSELRQSMQAIVSALREADAEMIDANYIAIAENFGGKIFDVYPGPRSVSAFYGWLDEIPPHYLDLATGRAANADQTTEKIIHAYETSLQHISKIETTFPVVAFITRQAIELAMPKTAQRLVSIPRLKSYVFDKWENWSKIFQKPDDDADFDQARILFANSIANMLSLRTRDIEQPDFDAMEAIVLLLDDWARREKDEQLKRLSRKAASNSARLRKVNTKSYLTDIQEASKLIGSFIGRERLKVMAQACEVLTADPGDPKRNLSAEVRKTALSLMGPR